MIFNSIWRIFVFHSLTWKEKLAGENCRQRLFLQVHFVFSSLVLIIMLTGCASVASKGLLPELETRRTPDIVLGEELILSQKSSMRCTILISKAGTAHVFTIDKDRKLNHIEIEEDRVVSRELLGEIESKSTEALDVIEYSQGKLRVLAAEKQYIRISAEGDWQEIKGNLCSRFVTVADELFCAFVTKGEEVNAPKRTDVTVGFIILIPVAWWSEVSASKLVLAQETPAGWVIRAVLDPDTPMDAGNDFLVEADNFGNLHVLYSTLTGGGGFVVLVGPHGGSLVGGGPWKKPVLNYARVRFDQLMAPPSTVKHQEASNYDLPMSWMPIKGSPLGLMPFVKEVGKSGESLRPLNRLFAVNKLTNSLDGLMWASNTTLIGENRKLYFYDTDHSWVAVRIHNGQWLDEFAVLSAKDLPISKHLWLDWNKSVLKSDTNGNLHVLLESSQPGFWTTRHFIHYFVKDDAGWSAPLELGSCQSGCDRCLSINNAGDAFVAWVNEKNKLTGRWIRKRKGASQN